MFDMGGLKLDKKMAEQTLKEKTAKGLFLGRIEWRDPAIAESFLWDILGSAIISRRLWYDWYVGYFHGTCNCFTR